MELLRFIVGIIFIGMGLLTFVIQLIGVFKFKYILNRMHAAGMGDTMGISLCLIGCMFLYGWGFTTLKVALIVAFLWLASPVSSHLISRLEVTTNEELEKYCNIEQLKQSEKFKNFEQSENLKQLEKQQRLKKGGNIDDKDI